MLIVDSQVHIWAADTPQRPWPPRRHQPHRPQPLSKDDLLREMQVAGVDRAIIVPPGWDGERNDLALAAARLHPQRFAMFARLKVDAPDARAELATLRAQPGMLGLRFSFIRRPEHESPLLDGRMEWVWSAAAEAGLPVMLLTFPSQLELVGRVAERHPDLKLAMDHLGCCFGQLDDAAFAHLDQFIALAKYPNIAVKATGLPGYSSDQYPYLRVHPYLRRVYDSFGPQRIFWGTDFTKLKCSYRQAVTMFTEEIPWLNSVDKEWIMGRALCAWLGWTVP